MKSTLRFVSVGFGTMIGVAGTSLMMTSLVRIVLGGLIAAGMHRPAFAQTDAIRFVNSTDARIRSPGDAFRRSSTRESMSVAGTMVFLLPRTVSVRRRSWGSPYPAAASVRMPFNWGYSRASMPRRSAKLDCSTESTTCLQ